MREGALAKKDGSGRFWKVQKLGVTWNNRKETRRKIFQEARCSTSTAALI